MTAAPIRIGTRGSALARWQAEWTAAALADLGVETELVFIKTTGDVTQGPLGEIGGVGLFTKAIQQALFDSEVDLAVHSLKDLPTEKAPGLILTATPERASNADALVVNADKTDGATTLETLPKGARIGTGSVRRKAQLLNYRQDFEIEDIRGNLDTRLEKLANGDYDAIILAAAGLTRMGWSDRISSLIPAEIMLPAIGQGALGLETRAQDMRVREIVGQLNDTATFQSVTAERTLLAELRGGCLAPVGGQATVTDQLTLQATVLSGDGKTRVDTTVEGDPTQAASLGKQAAEQLLEQGAAELIAGARSQP